MQVICDHTEKCPKGNCPHKEPHEQRGTCGALPCFIVNNAKVKCVRIVE